MSEYVPTSGEFETNKAEGEAALIARANQLYEAEEPWPKYLEAFTQPELVQLWDHCCSDFGAGFDDEVYDALAFGYNHFNTGGNRG